MLLCVGEILADMIGKKTGNGVEYRCFAGGAPFNVACGVARLGGNVRFNGRVGKDEIGRLLTDYARNVKGLKSRLTVDENRNTTLAFVTLAEDGERSFSFLRQQTADYAFLMEEVEDCLKDADTVHIGSLMLSEEMGRSFAEALADRAKALGKKISFDVNYREDIFETTAQAKTIYGSWLEKADILKLSEDEVSLFFGNSEKELFELSKNRKVFVTLGKKGSALYENGCKTTCPSIEVQPVDTTGAGDGFYAGVLYQLDKGVTEAKEILRFANVCGALATEKYGAIDGLPTYDEVKARLNKK